MLKSFLIEMAISLPLKRVNSTAGETMNPGSITGMMCGVGGPNISPFLPHRTSNWF